MQVFCHHFLAGTAFAGNQHAGVGIGDLVGEGDDAGHGRVAIEEVARFAGDGRDNGGDQGRVGGEWDVFLGAGPDGIDGGGGIALGPTGDHRDMDALAVERGNQAGDVDHHVHQQQIGAAAGAQARERDIDGGGVRDLGAAVHGELGGFGQLAFEGSDDQ